MKKLGAVVLLLALAATSCSRKQPSQAQAEAGRAPVSQPQAAANDMPQPATTVYPRAKLVALPGEPLPPASTPSSALTTGVAATDTGAPSNPPGSVPASTPAGAAGDTAMSGGPANASPDLTTGAKTAPVDTGATTNTTAVAIPETPPQPMVDSTEENVQVVVLQTTFGRIVIQLDDFAAPKTCANFRNLVSSGFYNGTIFHRVIPHFIIQGGDPNSKTDNRATYGQGDPGYTLPPEIKLSHDRGAVAMARLPDTVNPARDSNGSQFYICVEACPSLDDQYTVFGHVLQGMDVVERISNVPRDSRDDPLVRIVMDARLEQKSQALQETTAASH